MTRRSAWTCATACLLAGLWGMLTVPSRGQAASTITEITVERTPCYGTCPVYKVTLRRDGTATFVGTRFVDKIGTYTGRVYGFDRLAQAVQGRNFQQFKARYAAPATDQPTTITGVVRAGQRKTVANYGDAGPQALWEIQTLIDGAVAQTKWTKVTKQAPSPSRTSGRADAPGEQPHVD